MGIPPAHIYWVLTLCLVYAVTELAGFRMAWKSVLETDWFLMKQRTAKPTSGHCLKEIPLVSGYKSGQRSVRTTGLWERLTQGTPAYCTTLSSVRLRPSHFSTEQGAGRTLQLAQLGQGLTSPPTGTLAPEDAGSPASIPLWPASAPGQRPRTATCT